jgi:hypothetical protein
VKDIITWVKQNGDTIHTWAGIILGATVTIGTFLLILNWSKIMTAAANAVKVVRTAILGMNAAMLANPIALVVALIAGLVAAFLYLWKNNEGFRKFWLDMWEKVKNAASSAVKWISGKFDDLKGALDKAKTKFNEIQKTISDKMESAQKAVKKAIDKIKGFFDFSWSLPKLKMPHFTITGSFSLNPPSVPSLGIDWYKKAMNNGMILDAATIFGFNPKTGKFLGGGEAGSETVVGTKSLLSMIKRAVYDAVGPLVQVSHELARASAELGYVTYNGFAKLKEAKEV